MLYIYIFKTYFFGSIINCTFSPNYFSRSVKLSTETCFPSSSIEPPKAYINTANYQIHKLKRVPYNIGKYMCRFTLNNSQLCRLSNLYSQVF